MVQRAGPSFTSSLHSTCRTSLAALTLASLRVTHSDDRTLSTASPPTRRVISRSCSTIGRLPLGVSDHFPQQRWIRSRREKWLNTFDAFDPERGRSGHRGGLGWVPADLGDEARDDAVADECAPGSGPPKSHVLGWHGAVGGEERATSVDRPTAFTLAPRRS